MKNWTKVALMLGLMSLAVVAIGAELPFKIYTINATTTHVEIYNNTDSHVKVVGLIFSGSVTVTNALAYGPGAPLVLKPYVGAGQGWRLTLDKNGLAPGAFLRVAFVGAGEVLRVIGR